MCVARIGLYDHYAGIAKQEKKFSVCFNPDASIAIEEDKSSVGFETPCGIAKEERNPTCVLRPNVGIAIEKNKLICVLLKICKNYLHWRFWCLWRYYGFILSSMLLRLRH
jgi:hypothetical protein